MTSAAESASRETLRERMQGLFWACKYRAEEHRLCHRNWKLWSYILGTCAAIVTAIAGLGFIGSAVKGDDWLAVVAAGIAVAAAALTAANTALQPQTKAEAFKTAAAGYANLRVDIRDFMEMRLDLETPEVAYRAYEDFRQRRRRLQYEAPDVPQRIVDKVKRGPSGTEQVRIRPGV